MKRVVTISYFWNGNDREEIPELHVDALKEAALNRIVDQYQHGGYTSGELHESVRFGKDRVPEEDEDDGLSYSGWYSIEDKEDPNDPESD